MQVKKEKVTKVLTHLIHQDQLEVCMKDWAELADEYRDLELRHKEYREVLSICNTHKRKGKINEISCADLGEMHGPTEEVYQRSHTSGSSALSKSISHNFLATRCIWSLTCIFNPHLQPRNPPPLVLGFAIWIENGIVSVLFVLL